MLGGLSHIARKTIFGDERRSKAKQVARRQIEKARIDSNIRLRNLTKGINERIAENRDRMTEAIEHEMNNLQTIERIIEDTQRGITKFIEDIKSKEYGTI